MRIVDKSVVDRTMGGETRSVQHFGHLLGTKPHKLGLVATLYPELTMTYLTDSLMNVYMNESKGNQFQQIDSMFFEWDIEVNYIKQVNIVEDVTDTGLNFSPIRIVFDQKYYEKGDTFTLENRQELLVRQSPKILAPGRWEYIVTTAGNNANEAVDLNFATAGRKTRWRSCYFPEISERGFSKFHTSVEKHRNHITRHRASVSYSQTYKALEDVFIQTGKGGKDGKEDMFYKLNKSEKDCLDTLYFAKNQALLFGKSNFDINGKCMLQDENGQDIPKGDGAITQVERYCDKLVFSTLSVSIFDEALHTLRSKSQKSKGNKYVFMINDMMDNQVGKVLREYLRTYAQDGTYFFSKDNGTVQVGADFDTYMVQGNQISFVVDRCLSHEYPDRAYGVFLDLSHDLSTGRPAISSFTLRGGEMITGNLPGLGGMDGRTSGQISTSVSGSEYHLMAYAGVAVFNPYRAFILEESISA